MVLLKVLLVTLVSCQVIIYGGAISLNRFRSGQYHGMSFREFTSNEEHESVWDSPFGIRPWTRTTTQRSIQLARTNKEYGNKLAKSEIMPNTFFVLLYSMPWSLADLICSSDRGILASPQNKLQMHKLQAFLDVYGTPGTDGSGYWLGGRRKDDINGNDFYWTSNGKKISDELWSPSKPTAYEGRNCVEYQYSYDGMKLNNIYCELNRRFVCQVVEHDEYQKNDLHYQIVNNSTRKGHQEIKKISSEVTASAGGIKKSTTMTTTNASTNIISHQTNTTTTSTTTTTTEEYYSDSQYWTPIENPFEDDYDK